MNCTMRIIRLRELYYACSTIFLGKCAARPGGSSGRPTPTGALQGVRCVVGGRTEASAPTEGCMKCLRAGRCGHRPLQNRIMGCVGEGLSCPPLCRPIPGHCRARQSGHFLETGLLHPPLAALRRFPRPRATARVAPTEGYKRCGGVKNPPVTASP